MKKQYLTILSAVCGLALFLVGCATHTGEVLDTPAAPAVSAEDTANRLSADAGKGAEPEPAEPEPEETAPALTLEDIRTASISDISGDDGRADFIRYAVYQDFMQTDSDGQFSSESFVTRGELMNALWHVSGQKAPKYDGKFSDVAQDSPLAEPIAWAVKTGIAAGPDDGTFSPQASVSREQLAVFLYRFAAVETTNGDAVDIYRDGSQAADYARAPLAWALGCGLFGGMVSDTIHPSLPVSRAQLAQVLTAYAAYIEKEPLAQTLAEQLKVKQVESASRSRHDEVQKQIDVIATQYGATGLQVAVVENGEVVDSFSYGWAVKDVTPMTADYKIRSASITKVAVGMAAMILKEDGVIDLDESIGTYWGVPARNPSHLETEVSIRTLLSHSSSLKVFSWQQHVLRRIFGPFERPPFAKCVSNIRQKEAVVNCVLNRIF